MSLSSILVLVDNGTLYFHDDDDDDDDDNDDDCYYDTALRVRSPSSCFA